VGFFLDTPQGTTDPDYRIVHPSLAHRPLPNLEGLFSPCPSSLCGLEEEERQGLGFPLAWQTKSSLEPTSLVRASKDPLPQLWAPGVLWARDYHSHFLHWLSRMNK
jgi:hypothetical protein